MSAAEIRRLLDALNAPPAVRAHRLAWSRWRSQHQAVAHRCHQARRLRRDGTASDVAPAARGRSLVPTPTEEQWVALLALLNAADTRGHPPSLPHRPMLEGMLWLMAQSARWNDLPERFGPYRTVQTRYRTWRRSGLWDAILAILSPPVSTPVPPP